MNITYTVNDPRTGDYEDFNTKRAALSYAKKQSYTPVFIDIYDNDQQDIVDDIRVDVPNVPVIE